MVKTYYPAPVRPLLIEGLNAKDIVMDIVQVAVSSGAVVGTGGAGGDVVTDTLFAVEIAEDILSDVMTQIAELGELSAIVHSAMKLDFSGNVSGFYDDVKELVKRSVASELAGKKAKDFIEKTAQTVSGIIKKIVRAISKWVAALLPDDFGLSGPAFEASVSGAISGAAENAYDLAAGAIISLGETGKLLTDPEALRAFLTKIAKSILVFAEKVDDVIQNPDPEKASLAGSILGTAQLNIETSPLVAIGAWGARKAGVDTDTLGEDYLAWAEKLHPKDPRRLLAQKMTPKAVMILQEIIADWIPTAAEVMHKLISTLFACIAVFQMVMDPKERKELLNVKTRDYQYKDHLGIDDMDLGVNLAAGRRRSELVLTENYGYIKMKITKRQLRRIIKEEKAKILAEQPHHQMYEEDDELRQLGEIIENLVHYSMEGSRIMKDMGMRYGELAALGTNARTIEKLVEELADTFDQKLDDIVRFR